MNTTDTVNSDLLVMPTRIQTDNEDADDFCYFQPEEISHHDSLQTTLKEREIIGRIEQASIEERASLLLEIEDELYDNPDPISHFVLGTAGLICALSNVGCLVVGHGHGGIDSDYFPAPNPWITFFTSREMVSMLIAASEFANTRLMNAENGMLRIDANDIRNFNKMAEYLLDNSKG